MIKLLFVNIFICLTLCEHKILIIMPCSCFAEKLFLEDPELKDDLPLSYMSHREIYENSVRKAVLIAKKLRDLRDIGELSVDTYTLVIILIYFFFVTPTFSGPYF